MKHAIAGARRSGRLVLASLVLVTALGLSACVKPPVCGPADVEQATLRPLPYAGRVPSYEVTITGRAPVGQLTRLNHAFDTVRQTDWWELEPEFCIPAGATAPVATAPYRMTATVDAGRSRLGFVVVGRNKRIEFPVPSPEPVPLAGSRWAVDEVFTRSWGLVGDAPVTADFSATTVSGSAGCNTYEATYHVSGWEVTLGPIITTERACAPDIMAVEQTYLTKLAATRRYFVANSLELFNDRWTELYLTRRG